MPTSKPSARPAPATGPGGAGAPIPRWLRYVLMADRTGSAWYVGTGFFFAPILAMVSPWPVVTTVVWVAIALAGLWLGLLGIAMATGLAMVLRSNTEIGEDYWRSIIDLPRPAETGDAARPFADSPR
ncbi:hypothetical protein [Mycolicibacterium goodii]|uniref:Uncharacterized protein n=1 Tax=Mycolicibacterium goodii TaxID=134601 RepID=A0A0K0X9S6_MYCGD|nr:hypothetical protein AFA91_22190 [Mycolicibacterium goodii]